MVPTVQLDEIFTAFDEPTRQAFRVWQQDLAESFQGRGQVVSDAFGNLPSFASDATSALRILDSEAPALQRMIRDTGTVFAAITEDEAALRGLILNSSQVFQATAEQNDEIAETFRTFPTFLDESKATFTRLRTFALETNPLINDLRPVARDLRPTLRDLRGLSPDLKQLFVDLGPLIDVSRVGLPALNETLRGLDPLLEATTPFLEELNPILQWLQLYSKHRHRLPRERGQRPGGDGGDPAPTTRSATTCARSSPNGAQNLGFARERSPDNRGNTYLGPTVACGARDGQRVHLPQLGLQGHRRPGGQAAARRADGPRQPARAHSGSAQHVPARRDAASPASCSRGSRIKDEGARENFGGKPGPNNSNDAYRRFPHIDHNHYRQDGD